VSENEREANKQKLLDLEMANFTQEERIRQLQSDLECVLKDNEEKNNEIASLNLDIRVQQVKNESLYMGGKLAADEAYQNE
jgi:hypothetical protein